MADEQDVEIREGFVCPMCMTQLQSPAELLAHFEEAHPADGKEKDQGKSSGRSGKASRRSKGDVDEAQHVPEVVWEKQTLGPPSLL